MPVAIGIILSLLPIVVIAGIIAATVTLVRRRSEPGEDTGIGTVRRLYTYGLSFAGLVTAAIGAALLLGAILDALFSPTVISVGQTTLALGLALAIVGTPVWLLFWSMAQRSVRRLAVETRAISRKVYLYLVLAVSALVAAVSATLFLRWLFSLDNFSGTPVAMTLVWSGVWAFHWVVENRDGQPTESAKSLRRLYVYVLALFGMVELVVGTIGVLRSGLGAAYEALFEVSELLSGRFDPWNAAMHGSLSTALVGGALWWWHWHRVAAGDVESGLRHIYLYLFAVLGGAAIVVSSLSVLLFRVLQWFVGRPEAATARLHFDTLPGVTAAVVVGAGLWGYHWAVVRQEAVVARRGLTAAQRVYSYLVSAVGMVTLGIGLVTVFATAIGLLSPAEDPLIAGPDWWRNPLVLAVTLLVVGVPVWGLHWRDVQHATIRGGPEERASLSRRVFIFLIFGVSVLLALINLSIVLFRLFDAAFGQGTPSNVLWEVRWSIGMLLTAGAVSVYYWLVLREDRQALAGLEEAVERPAPPKSVTALVTEGDVPLVRRLETRLGYTVQVWQHAEARALAPTLSEEQLAETEQRIRSADSSHVFLLVDAEGIRVVPYHGL